MAEGPWKISVCLGCGEQIAETYEYRHDDHPGGEYEVEVVPEAMLEAAELQLDHLLAAIETVESRWGQPAVRIDESLARLYETAEQIRRERATEGSEGEK